MVLKILFSAFAFTIVSTAAASQTSTYPVDGAQITYDSGLKNIKATALGVSGKWISNSLTQMTVNSEMQARCVLDDQGFVRLTLEGSSVSFVIGKVSDDGKVTLYVPYKAYQVSERYDAIEKSFGQIDTDFISIDVTL